MCRGPVLSTEKVLHRLTFISITTAIKSIFQFIFHILKKSIQIHYFSLKNG